MFDGGATFLFSAICAGVVATPFLVAGLLGLRPLPAVGALGLAGYVAWIFQAQGAVVIFVTTAAVSLFLFSFAYALGEALRGGIWRLGAAVAKLRDKERREKSKDQRFQPVRRGRSKPLKSL